MNLFVYGTLKQGRCRAHLLAGQRLLGHARTRAHYRLLNRGNYPALVEAAPTQESVRVEGEVWSIDPACLQRLDQVEGVEDGLFGRREIDLEDWRGETVQAYFYLRPTDGLPDCGERW